jgi:tol-pal system-associated acyl-CoA thioesterase
MQNPDDLPTEPSISCQITVYYYDTDAGGVVHNIAYLRHIEEARTRLAQYLGWSLKEMAQGTLAPVVRRTEIDYIAPARLGDVLDVHARLVSLAGARFDVGFEIFTSSDSNSPIVKCRQTLACVNLLTMRPARVPEAWRKKWPHLLL